MALIQLPLEQEEQVGLQVDQVLVLMEVLQFFHLSHQVVVEVEQKVVVEQDFLELLEEEAEDQGDLVDPLVDVEQEIQVEQVDQVLINLEVVEVVLVNQEIPMVKKQVVMDYQIQLQVLLQLTLVVAAEEVV
jgi:hypothetical protein